MIKSTSQSSLVESTLPKEIPNGSPVESLQNGALSWKTKFAYGIGHVLNDLCASMWFTYLLVYFHLVLKFTNSLSGILLLVGQIADGLSTPFVGFESDKVDNCVLFRYGRRKTWHLIGTICVVISFPFLFIKCIGCENSHQWAQLLYYSAFAIIFQFGWASVQVSHLSLIPDLTHNTHERTELNAIRYAFTVMSNICVYSLTWLIFGVTGTQGETVDSDDTSKFQFIVITVVALGFLFSVIFHVGVKEPSFEAMNASFSANYSSVTERTTMTWKDWLKEIQFYQIALLYMCTRLFANLNQVYVPLFLQDTLKLEKSSIAIIPLVMFVSGFLSSFFMKIITRKLGKKITYLVGTMIGFSACVWIFFGAGDSFKSIEDAGDSFKSIQLYFVAVLLGISGSTMIVTSLALTNDLIGYNTESSAFVFGAMSFTDKLSNGITVLLIQYFIPCTTCCSNCASYFTYVLSCGCGVAALVALFSIGTLAPYEIGNRNQGINNSEEDVTTPLLSSNASCSTSYTIQREDKNPIA